MNTRIPARLCARGARLALSVLMLFALVPAARAIDFELLNRLNAASMERFNEAVRGLPETSEAYAALQRRLDVELEANIETAEKAGVKGRSGPREPPPPPPVQPRPEARPAAPAAPEDPRYRQLTPEELANARRIRDEVHAELEAEAKADDFRRQQKQLARHGDATKADIVAAHRTPEEAIQDLQAFKQRVVAERGVRSKAETERLLQATADEMARFQAKAAAPKPPPDPKPENRAPTREEWAEYQAAAEKYRNSLAKNTASAESRSSPPSTPPSAGQAGGSPNRTASEAGGARVQGTGTLDGQTPAGNSSRARAEPLALPPGRPEPKLLPAPPEQKLLPPGAPEPKLLTGPPEQKLLPPGRPEPKLLTGPVEPKLLPPGRPAPLALPPGRPEPRLLAEASKMEPTGAEVTEGRYEVPSRQPAPSPPPPAPTAGPRRGSLFDDPGKTDEARFTERISDNPSRTLGENPYWKDGKRIDPHMGQTIQGQPRSPAPVAMDNTKITLPEDGSGHRDLQQVYDQHPELKQQLVDSHRIVQSGNKAYVDANAKVNALDRAAASGNAVAIREAALGVQGDPIAVQILNKQRPEDLRAVQRQTMDGIKQDMVRIARDNVAAASTRVPGAPVDSARVDIYMPENAPGKPAAAGADQIRAGHDIDATVRLDGKDIPAAQSRQALSEAFFEAATGKKPSTPAERAEAVRFAEEHNMVATDRLHPEAYGRTPRDAAQILGPDKRTPVRDPAQLSGAIQYKSDAARNEAIRLREEAARVDLEAQALKDQGRMGEAIAKVKEADAIRLRADGKAFDQAYQGVKQLDKQVQPRVEAMGGQVPAHVQKGMDILRQVDSLEISPEQARQKLAAMGETVESITRKSAGLVEAAQVLKPPTQSNASLLNGGKSSFATPPEPNFEQKVGAAGEQIFQAMGGGALPPGASALRQGINSAGGTIVKGAGALGVAHMAVTTGKDALEYKQLYDKLNDPNTTDAEANQIAARMDQIARGTAVGMSVGAAVASVPLVGQAAMVGGGAYVGTRYVIDNTKAGQAVDRAALGAIDAGMQGGEWAGEKLTGLAGGTTKLQLDQQQIAGLQSSYQQALARGDIRLKDGMTEAEVMAAIRRDGPHAAAGLVEPTPRGAIDAIDRLLQDPRVKPGGDESSLLRNLAVNMSSGTDAEREAAREKFAQYQQQKAQQQTGPPLPDLPPTYAPLTAADAERAQQIKDRWDAAPDGSPEKARLGDMYQALAYGDAKQKEMARGDLALPPAAASASAGGMGAGADGGAAQAAGGGPGVQGSSLAANAIGDVGNVYGAAPSAGGMSFGDMADVVKQGIKQARDKLVDSAADNLAHDMDLNVQREEIQKKLGDPNLSADDRDYYETLMKANRRGLTVGDLKKLAQQSAGGAGAGTAPAAGASPNRLSPDDLQTARDVRDAAQAGALDPATVKAIKDAITAVPDRPPPAAPPEPPSDPNADKRRNWTNYAGNMEEYAQQTQAKIDELERQKAEARNNSATRRELQEQIDKLKGEKTDYTTRAQDTRNALNELPPPPAGTGPRAPAVTGPATGPAVGPTSSTATDPWQQQVPGTGYTVGGLQNDNRNAQNALGDGAKDAADLLAAIFNSKDTSDKRNKLDQLAGVYGNLQGWQGRVDDNNALLGPQGGAPGAGGLLGGLEPLIKQNGKSGPIQIPALAGVVAQIDKEKAQQMIDSLKGIDLNTKAGQPVRVDYQTFQQIKQIMENAGYQGLITRQNAAQVLAQAQNQNSLGNILGQALIDGTTQGATQFGNSFGTNAASSAGGRIFGGGGGSGGTGGNGSGGSDSPADGASGGGPPPSDTSGNSSGGGHHGSGGDGPPSGGGWAGGGTGGGGGTDTGAGGGTGGAGGGTGGAGGGAGGGTGGAGGGAGGAGGGTGTGGGTGGGVGTGGTVVSGGSQPGGAGSGGVTAGGGAVVPPVAPAQPEDRCYSKKTWTKVWGDGDRTLEADCHCKVSGDWHRSHFRWFESKCPKCGGPWGN